MGSRVGTCRESRREKTHPQLQMPATHSPFPFNKGCSLLAFTITDQVQLLVRLSHIAEYLLRIEDGARPFREKPFVHLWESRARRCPTTSKKVSVARAALNTRATIVVHVQKERWCY